MLARTVLRQRTASIASKAAFSTSVARNAGTLPASHEKVSPTKRHISIPNYLKNSQLTIRQQLLRDHLPAADPEVSKILEAVRTSPHLHRSYTNDSP
jgi:hypothetical protein